MARLRDMTSILSAKSLLRFAFLSLPLAAVALTSIWPRLSTWARTLLRRAPCSSLEKPRPRRRLVIYTNTESPRVYEVRYHHRGNGELRARIHGKTTGDWHRANLHSVEGRARPSGDAGDVER